MLMPYKDKRKKAEYNLEYQNKRYKEDPEFKKLKIKRELEWRAKHKEEYNEYMRKLRKRKHQHQLWLKYITVWKAQKNRAAYLEIMRNMSNSEAWRNSKTKMLSMED